MQNTLTQLEEKYLLETQDFYFPYFSKKESLDSFINRIFNLIGMIENQERTVSYHLDQKRPNRKRLGLFLTLFHQSNIKFYGAVCGFKANSLVMTVNCFTFFTSQIHCRKTVNLITNNTPMT